ncbi:MAG: polysaccharide deacetylase family protein [Sphingobacteriia bacterium]|nr:MAG: polysaccharide deacetylase family protein [Sphingobacteriia bacterium]
MYLVKTPWWLRALYPSFIWKIETSEPTIYLTFDDGPHETATPFVLDILQQYNAKASFFCIGKNVRLHPEIYQRILAEGHAVGNHTEHHLNGWKTKDEDYLQNIAKAATQIKSHLFRPPYGRIKNSQATLLKTNACAGLANPEIIMWDVLSGDFDLGLSPESCLQNVLKATVSGSIVVFHDSAKAWDRMSFALPKILKYFSDAGYGFKALPQKGRPG